MRAVALSPGDFPEKVRLRGLEGAVIYTAERDVIFYLVEDERTMADFLDDDDLAGESLTRTWAFDTEAERTTYARQRGWVDVRRSEHRRMSD